MMRVFRKNAESLPLKKKIIITVIAVVVAVSIILGVYCLYRKSCVICTFEIPEKDVKISILSDGTDWPFGASHISIYRNYRKFCKEEIHNDGKSLDEYNFEAYWDDQFIYITLKGEEQSPKTVAILIG